MDNCSNTYCILTEIGLSIKNAGTIGVCNQIREELYTEDGDLFRLDKNTLTEAWNSPSRINLRNDLNNGIKRSCCSDCWNEEDSGRDSKRQISNTIYKDIIPLPDQPRVLMLKPGNACNLGCRHCDLFSSSNLINDYFAVESDGIDVDEYKVQLTNLTKSFLKSNSVWKILESWSAKMISFELYGAEPLLINSLWKVLTVASNSANANNMSIYINTNGTIWRDDYYDVFKNFKLVRIAISVDGIHEQFEYMRQPAKFDTFISNLKKFDELPLQNIVMETCITVSILNIYYLPETIAYLTNLTNTHLHLRGKPGTNMVHYPLHLNLMCLPAPVKEAIVQKLEVYALTHFDVNESEIYRAIYSNILNVSQFLQFDMDNSEQHFKDFWRITKGYDLIRDESYESTFPEMYEIMLPYLTNNS